MHLLLNNIFRHKIDKSVKTFLLNKYLSKINEQMCKLSDNCVRLSYYKINAIHDKQSVDTLLPILIFHGLFGNKNNWKTISKSIASKSGRNVYSFDLRNHGLSPHTSGIDSHLIGMSNDIQLFLDENHFKKAILIGHSLGGRAVMQFAFKESERVEKLIGVDISPLPSIPSAFFLSPTFIDQLSQSIENISSQLTLSEARKQVNQNLRNIIADNFIRGFFLMSLDKDENGIIIWRFNLPAIKYMIENKFINKLKIEKPFVGKTLIIYGQDSDYVKFNDYNAILEVMPNANFISIPETGHYLHIEKPNEFTDKVMSFINS